MPGKGTLLAWDHYAYLADKETEGLAQDLTASEWLVRMSVQYPPTCFGASGQGSDDDQGKRRVWCLSQASSDQRGPEGSGDPHEGAEGAGPAPRQLSSLGEAPLMMLSHLKAGHMQCRPHARAASRRCPRSGAGPVGLRDPHPLVPKVPKDSGHVYWEPRDIGIVAQGEA